jgi:preprotein translocase subunit SecA
MDEMRQGIGLRAYGSTDPLVAYKREARDMWDQLLENIRSTMGRQIFHARLAAQQPPPVPMRPLPQQLRESGPSENPAEATAPNAPASAARAATATRTRPVRKVGRNDVCPCGSGLKYKRCHGLNG